MTTRRIPIACSLALLGATGLAVAAGWQDYAPAFPGQPCADGWAGCIVGDTVVTPGMVLDGAARPHPADMRVGFFDLDPLPGLSPFGGLSAYSGQLAGSKPERPAAPPPVEQPVASAGQGRSEVASNSGGSGGSGGRGSVTDEDAAATEALNRAQLESRSGRTASVDSSSSGSSVASAPASTGRTIETPSSSASSSPPASTGRTTDSSASTASTSRTASNTPPATTPTSTPPVSTPPATVTPPVSTPPASTPPVADMATPADNSCDDLVALEAPAMMGQLGVPRRKCLEARISTEDAQTTKGKISRVLMADAEARRDQADWERLIKNHLENIDRSDPNLCLKYSIYLARGGAGKASQVIRWSDYALENKQQWSSSTYTKNVYALMKLKTNAANQLWQAAEKEFVTSRADEAEDKANKYRGMTKNFALEWLDYAKASGQDTKAPLALCVSAAGNKEFCEG